MIKVQNVFKSFDSVSVLDDISFEFEQGKNNLIIGQSGSGKTVLLKSIVGLFEIDKGDILYDGASFSSMNLHQRRDIRKEIGMLFQGSALFDWATVEENVRFPLDMFTDMSDKEKSDRVNYCLDRVNIQNANKLLPSEISGGMQKRVAIARAISMKPKYLFCDEPNSGLDPKTSIVIDNLISSITKELNITTIINTHDMNTVTEFGDKILFIAKGKKCWEGSKNTIFNSDNEELNQFVFASSVYKKFREQKHSDGK